MSSEVLCADTNLIEKHFRESRKITIPSERRKGRCNVIGMREVLQNWFEIKKIDTTLVTKHMIPVYRGYVHAYLKDKQSKCPRAYHAIIEEYRRFITGEAPIKERETGLPNTILKEHEMIQRVLDTWFYDEMYKTMSQNELLEFVDYRNKILEYYAGKKEIFNKNHWSLLDSKRNEILYTGTSLDRTFDVPRRVGKENDNKGQKETKAQTQTTPEAFVNLIDYLKKSGVKEFILRF